MVNLHRRIRSPLRRQPGTSDLLSQSRNRRRETRLRQSLKYRLRAHETNSEVGPVLQCLHRMVVQLNPVIILSPRLKLALWLTFAV
jgi:hypothetical protein